MRFLKLSFFLLFLILVNNCFGQDPLFSQFYSNPLYLNPALTGTTDLPRATVNYRNQWPQKNGTYTTYSLSFDGFIKKMNGGLGALLTHDRELNDIINTTNFSLFYSYHIMLSPYSYITAGIQAGLIYKQLNTGNLVFPGMIDQSTGIISGSLPAGFESTSKTLPDFAVGAVGQSNDFFWGASVHHLSQPDESLISGDQKGRLPLKYTLHFGGRTHKLHHGLLSKVFTVSPNVLYQQQGGFKQFNMGLYLVEKSLTLGAWYRNNLTVRPDAVIALIGFTTGRFQAGYSFDFTLSRLSSMSYGSHEISMTFFIGSSKESVVRKGMIIPPI
jgi:type IX secretion system PorP/SprF family membrane protein